uniref:Uncharacterized protein n=1 Tax=Aureoumbra lagunensis TaxID=44058 RepID=A0A7S3K133_9STRA
MPRKAIKRAREEFPDWQERPCMEEWKVRSHPCPWYRFGHECNRPWSDLTHPGDYVVLSFLYVALVLALFALWYLLYASRKKRCTFLSLNHGGGIAKKKKTNASRNKKLLVRTMSQDALGIAADGSERFVWKSYNDYERAIIWTIFVTIIQLISYVDPNGFYKLLSLPVRCVTYGSIRIFVDLTLFQMAAGYRKALNPVGTPRDWGVVIGFLLSTIIQAVTLTLENTQVPKAGRPSCAHSGWNFVRHFGSSVLEFVMIFITLRYALRVRSKLKRSKSRRLRSVVDQIITRTFLLLSITIVVMGWNAFVGARQAGERYACYLPACTFPEFFSTVFWAVLYVAVTWFGVIFFGVGIPPPISCLGSKPTISALCCCCPRPSWLAPASARLSYASSIDDFDDTSEHSNSTELRTSSFVSTPPHKTHSFLGKFFALLLGTSDIAQHDEDDGSFDQTKGDIKEDDDNARDTEVEA